ncbi:MAG: hypothetical protein WC700_18645 [Gemmatimonadaceae bacterium]|jgi:hypothetical protein
MSPVAIVFWLTSWGCVLGLAGWCFFRILRHKKHHDPDGTGPAAPPVPGAAEPPREA